MAGKKAKPAKARSTEAKKTAFLAAYEICGKVGKAAELVGITRMTHYVWLQNDENFKARFRLADRVFATALKDEAIRRAHDGVHRLKFYQGDLIMVPDPSGKMVPDFVAQMVLNPTTLKWEHPLTPALVPYVEHEYSDQLLTLLLKAKFPKLFGDKSKIDLGGELGLKVTGKSSMLPTQEEALQRLAQLAARLPKKLKK